MINELKNKRKKLEELKKRLHAGALATAITITSLTGCNNANTTNNEIVTTQTSTTSISTQTSTESTTIQATEERQITTESTTSENQTSKDEEILNLFENYNNEIKELYDQKNIEEISKKGREYFIKYVDFIFYGTEINGITFDKLKEESKKQLFVDLCEMDELIMIVAPNYKETISEKYNVVCDFVKEKYYDSLTKIKETLGEDKVNKVNEIKNTVEDKASDTYEEAIKKLKIFYEDYRDN